MRTVYMNVTVTILDIVQICTSRSFSLEINIIVLKFCSLWKLSRKIKVEGWICLVSINEFRSRSPVIYTRKFLFGVKIFFIPKWLGTDHDGRHDATPHVQGWWQNHFSVVGGMTENTLPHVWHASSNECPHVHSTSNVQALRRGPDIYFQFSNIVFTMASLDITQLLGKRHLQ
jgi:hypothetical protein